MRACLITLLLLTAPSTAWATTVTVHNRSSLPVTLAVDKSPSGYEDHLRPVMEPGLISSVHKPGGKVLMPHAQADEASFAIRYLDQSGSGCRFSVTSVRHSGAYARALPVAEPIAGGRCEASTGRTIGDFVFTVR